MNTRPIHRLTRRAACAALLAPCAWAQAPSTPYPSRPIRLIVPFAPGGPTDIAARMFADELAKALGQAVVVDNRPGAGGNIGAEAAAHAAPDDHTLFWAQAATHAINPTLYPKLGYDVLADFAPIGLVLSEPLVIVAHPGFAADDVPGLVALAKARRVTFGSGGHGSTPHMACQLFAQLAGAPLAHVPYKGNAPAVADVMAGHIDIVFDGVNAALGHIRSGKLKALGVTGRERAALLPQVAPVADTLPTYDVTSWGGLAAPAATTTAVIERIAAALQAIGAQAEVQQRFARLGMHVLVSSPQHMDDFVRLQIARWRPLVQAAGGRPE